MQNSSNPTTPTPKALAAQFVARAQQAGFTIDVRDLSVVQISKSIRPNDSAEFIKAEADSSYLLGLAPLRGGTVWGTDGGSVGGHIAMRSGAFHMCKSGSGAIKWVKEVARLLAAE